MSQKVKALDDTKGAVPLDEAWVKRVEKTELDTHNIDTLKHVEKKLIDKGVVRLERHPRDGLPLDKQPKSGRGGKYTWEGPARDMVESEMEVVPAAIDERDPNYVDKEVEEEDVSELVVGEVEVAKLAEDGVGRIDVDPKLTSV